MEDLIATIRAAGAPDATPESRAAAAAACRSLLAALGEPVSSAPLAVSSPPPIASVVAALRGVPPDQLLELAIGRLRAALPPGVEVPRVEPLKFHIISIPPRG